VPLSMTLATALAWLTERTDLPGARLWSWLAVAPLAVPAFVQSYGWVSVVPGLTLLHFQRETVVTRPLPLAGLTRSIYLVQRREGSLSVAAQTLHDLILARMK